MPSASVCSGMNSSREFCGHTETCLTKALEKSPLSFCLVLISDHHRRRLSSRPPSLSQLQWKIIETNQSSVYLQARNWQPLPSSDETGRNRKLSQPWQSPYRVLQTTDTTLTLEKVYHTKQEQLHVHQDRVKFCPPDLPPGYILLVWLMTLFPG